MQCPPTKPGLYDAKFHLVSAASKTFCVSKFNLLKIIDSSFTKAIFRSLCVFSITFAASAIYILSVTKIPALIIFLYNLAIRSVAYLFEPLTILTILVSFRFDFPGLILSGEYPI